jgi:hypothetical protein
MMRNNGLSFQSANANEVRSAFRNANRALHRLGERSRAGAQRWKTELRRGARSGMSGQEFGRTVHEQRAEAVDLPPVLDMAAEAGIARTMETGAPA